MSMWAQDVAEGKRRGAAAAAVATAKEVQFYPMIPVLTRVGFCSLESEFDAQFVSRRDGVVVGVRDMTSDAL
jgi:hypothetical protein